LKNGGNGGWTPGKILLSAITGLRAQPFALAIVIINLAVLLSVYLAVVDLRKNQFAETKMLIERCLPKP